MHVVSILKRYTSLEILYNVSFSSTCLLVLNIEILDDGGGNKSGDGRDKSGWVWNLILGAALQVWLRKENTLGYKENLATVATVGRGRCRHLFLGVADDAVWVMFLPLAHCDVFSISNDKSFSHLLSVWLPPSFFHEHSREKALSADTPATSSLGLPVTEPVQMQPHEEGDPAVLGAYVSTGGIWWVAAMSQQRDRIHRWAFEMQRAVHLL